MSGEIPPELGNLARLEKLILNDNQLSGEIPPELGNLHRLLDLRLQNTELSGCLPSVFSRGFVESSGLGGLEFCP